MTHHTDSLKTNRAFNTALSAPSRKERREELKARLARHTEEWLAQGNQVTEFPSFEQDTNYRPVVASDSW